MKKRIISAIVALLIVVPLLLIGDYYWAALVAIIGALGYKEVLDLKKSHNEYPVLIKILGLIALEYIILYKCNRDSISFMIEYAKIIIPLLLLLLPVIFYKDNKYTTKDAFYLLCFTYVLGLTFHLFIIIRNIDIFILIYLISVTVLTDTFAYIIGKLIGSHKMAPTISPNKSWEGSIGGLIGGVTISVIIYSNLISRFNYKIIIMSIILSIVGQIGDLFYSKIKRENDIKDFSNIMPGHGGILDRLDSLSFVIITYLLVSIIL